MDNTTSNGPPIIEHSTPSTTERVMTDVPPPIKEKLEHAALFNDDGKVNILNLQKHLFGEGRLYHEDVTEIFTRATEILLQEPTLLHVEAPITGMLNITHECAVLVVVV